MTATYFDDFTCLDDTRAADGRAPALARSNRGPFGLGRQGQVGSRAVSFDMTPSTLVQDNFTEKGPWNMNTQERER